MSGPEMRRLLDEGGSDLEQTLLRSARDDAPAPHTRRRTLVALGLGGSIVTATTATAASTTGFALLKWVGLAMLGSALVVGGAKATGVVGDAPSADPIPAAKGQSAVVAQVIEHVAHVESKAVSPAAAEPAAAPEPVAIPEPVQSASEEPKKAKVAAAAPQQPKSTLAEEVAALDKAREALGSDPARALEALEKHQKEFARGALGPEAMELRIEALAAKGDRAAATALANEFLSKYPTSPLASRVRSVVAAQTTP
jgi:hypothetical protein